MKNRKFYMEEICDLAGVPYESRPYTEVWRATDGNATLVEQENGGGNTDSVIKALMDTDYRDKDAFFKMVELLKGLAVASEKDEKAKEYLSAVSDALTDAAKGVLGEAEVDAEAGKKVDRYFVQAGETRTFGMTTKESVLMIVKYALEINNLPIIVIDNKDKKKIKYFDKYFLEDNR